MPSLNKKIADRMTPPVSRTQCEWQFDGVRCKYEGSCSHTILGGGPYYCRWHFSGCDMREGARIAKESQAYTMETTQAAEKAFGWEVQHSLSKLGLTQRDGEAKHEHIKRMIDHCLSAVRTMASKQPSKDWARRVMANHQAGETLLPVAVQCATDAIGQPTLEREPGCDD